MGILGPVVQPFVLPVLNAGQDRLLGSGVAGQLVGDHDTGGRICFLSSLRSKRSAAALSRRLWTKVIAHPGWVMASLDDAVASTQRRSSRTERLLTLAVLTTERNAA